MTSPAERDEEALDYSYMQRVKVYKLNESGTWDDKGTGHVSCEYMEQSNAAGLVVISEEDTSTLLIHRISREDIYQRQGADTIISWIDLELGTEIAISFQETIGCNYIWEQIHSVQTQYSNSKGEVTRASPRVVDEFDVSGGTRPGINEDSFSEECYNEGPDPGMPVEFPAPDLNNLAEVAKIIHSATAARNHEKVVAALLKKGYLRKLLELFRTVEDLEDAESLAYIFKALKGVVLLNDTNIFEFILSEENVMDVVGALEYDPELTSKQNHRAFLRDSVVFKEVVPITDPNILAKIHQTYRIGYLKDVILARVLDDASFNTLSSLVLFNNVVVALGLQNDPNFFRELFSRLQTHDPDSVEWKDLISFLQELCNIAKFLQPAHRSQLFSTLTSHSILEVLTRAVGVNDAATRLRALDILLACLNQIPGTLRDFLNHQPSHQLFSLLVDGLLTHDQDGIQEQTLEILRLLLDPDSPEQSVNLFLETFYEKYVDQLVAALTHCLTPNSTAADKSKPIQPQGSASTLNLIVELLCFCVRYHSYRIKYYVLRNNVVEKVLKLTQRPERFLVVSAVRFLRTCIGLKDEFYHRYLTKNNLFAPVIEVFLSNGDRYNLLNSAVIEMVDFIRRENIKSLIAHLVEQFGTKLEGINYVDTFQLLKVRYEQHLEGRELQGGGGNGADGGASGGSAPDTSSTAAHPQGFRGMDGRRQRREGRGLDKDEEDYFSTGSDDSDDESPHHPAQPSASGSSERETAARGPLGLVDYRDEEDEPLIGPSRPPSEPETVGHKRGDTNKLKLLPDGEAAPWVGREGGVTADTLPLQEAGRVISPSKRPRHEDTHPPTKQHPTPEAQ